MKVAIPLAKNVLVPLPITVPASAIDAGIQKKKTKKKKTWIWHKNFNNFKGRNESYNKNCTST